MLQRVKNILKDYWMPLQSVAVVFLFLAALLMVLWMIMALMRILIG